ncbi:nucleotide-binding protein [Nonomuraea maritima]|uniref:nucleotide-binding protein n=1 Tax=Nonomuraea maritima TaxID=683260 RepID=UPI003719AF76
MARHDREESLEEQLAWLDAIKEEETPVSVGAPAASADEPAASPYPKDPWRLVPEHEAPTPPLFRTAASARDAAEDGTSGDLPAGGAVEASVEGAGNAFDAPLKPLPRPDDTDTYRLSFTPPPLSSPDDRQEETDAGARSWFDKPSADAAPEVSPVEGAAEGLVDDHVDGAVEAEVSDDVTGKIIREDGERFTWAATSPRDEPPQWPEPVRPEEERSARPADSSPAGPRGDLPQWAGTSETLPRTSLPQWAERESDPSEERSPWGEPPEDRAESPSSRPDLDEAPVPDEVRGWTGPQARPEPAVAPDEVRGWTGPQERIDVGADARDDDAASDEWGARSEWRSADEGSGPRSERRHDEESRQPEWRHDDESGRQSGWPADEEAGRQSGWPADNDAGRRAGWSADEEAGRQSGWPPEEREAEWRGAEREPVSRRNSNAPVHVFTAPPRPPVTGRPSVDSLDPDTLLRGRRNAPSKGWRRVVYKASGGWIKPGEPPEERRRRELLTRARTPVTSGHHRVAVLSLKGGVGKTTTTVGLGATLAQVRGDRVIAVDANPDRGTLSDKLTLETSATVRDLLNERDQVKRYVDIRAFTSQAPSRLEVLASDRDPSVSEAFSGADYQAVAEVLENFYSICITDCGTGLLHSAMGGVLGMADQIVLVSSPSVDGARAASATLDWLEAHEYGNLVKSATVVLCSVRPRSKSAVDIKKLEAHFAARCRAVVRVPYDPHLEEGAEIDLDRLQESTREAYLRLAASVGDGFAGK